jgi:hypothetical protein
MRLPLQNYYFRQEKHNPIAISSIDKVFLTKAKNIKNKFKNIVFKMNAKKCI